ncbi:class D sortase [Terribacillus sp. DMT04]|uniref:class D sortase n=1 Tax=Terribacillus sp. DMT04 TaxID=2850441 RepID=UPI001C2C2BF4|nr:class D sortase [Terribacillus sp. DMT04]QXE01284.1 class D sortase [Terribacillus sp. DMT04]
MKKLIGSLFILAGILLGSYTLIQWNGSASSAQDFEEEDKQLAEEVLEKSHKTNEIIEEKTDKISVASPKEENYKVGDKVAMLSIPKIEKKFSVFWGTDENTLEKGVGMMDSDSTTTPAKQGHTVLSGHRDTVFVELGELAKGDHLLLTVDEIVYSYEISDIWITDKDDRTVIVPKAEATLTLTTCYPFDFIGHAEQRYIIQGKLIG